MRLLSIYHPPGRARRERLRRNLGAMLADGGFGSLAFFGRHQPLADPRRLGVERVQDIPYLDSGLPAHRLDIYRPPASAGSGPLPVCFYIHGGGFRFLSKESHWMMGVAFARAGYLCFNISYRLAPEHPYPAAIEDVCAAYGWMAKNLEAWGGDPSRIVISGDSAGGNLAAALCCAACFERPEPFARKVLEEAPVPAALIAACGVLQVSDPERFARRRKISRFLQDRLEEVRDAYLWPQREPGGLEDPQDQGMADPLLLLESEQESQRPFPATFAFAGTKDPLLDDSRRLVKALHRRERPATLSVFHGEMHVFHTMLWRKAARRVWKQSFDFLESAGCAPHASSL